MRKAMTAGLALAAGFMLAGEAAQAQGFVMPAETDARSGQIMAQRQEKLEALTPVTDALLQNPPDGEWVDWRRTYDGWGYSPLKQINRGNVKGLQLAWSWSLASGPTNGVPLVHDGVIFVQHYGDTLEALDAATGDLLWRYKRRVPRGVAERQKRGIAIWGENIYATTSDSKLIAVNMKTGELTWEQDVDEEEKGFYISGSPIVVKGKVLIGTTGCASAKVGSCFIAAFDADTGKRAWRFNTVAQPGTPGGDTWNGLPAEQRFGGAVWTAGTYDADLNLVYFGVGQPYPWNAYTRGTSPEKPGEKNNALFTNTTLALNPDTGELVWYHQYLPNDSWDMDYAFDRQIVEMKVDGKMRKLVVTAGKMAIVEAVDAETGAFVFAKDLGLQTLVTAIDPKTGEKTFDPKLEPVPGKTYTFCPHAGGARSWPGAGYDPDLKRLFLPLQKHCTEYEPVKPTGDDEMGGGAVRWKILPPQNADGHFGRLDAVDLEKQDWAWKYDDRAPQSTASLPTAGGVVFQGTFDRYFAAHDSRNGKLLWQTRLGDVPNSYPVSYEVDGRQYVAVMTGSGGPYTSTWQGLIPDIRLPAQSGGGLYVFALPE
jgi:alcohol dehydrogenase (cytochrome c)